MAAFQHRLLHYLLWLAFGALASYASTESTEQHGSTVLVEHLPMHVVCCGSTWTQTTITRTVTKACETCPPQTQVPTQTRESTDASWSSGLTASSQTSASSSASETTTQPPLPYPSRTAEQVKGIYADFWPDMDDIWDANPGGQSLYLIWADWEPVNKAPPCAADEQEYDGHCFLVVPEVDKAIGAWSDRKLVTTAIVYGTPAWARGRRPCAAGIYCVPDDAADFGRFAGMLARRYNGHNGHGRIADFVLDREVGNSNYFDIGCGPAKACDKSEWIDLIASNYKAGYDAVYAEQSTARIMTSIDNKFGLELEDVPGGQLCGMTVLEGLAANAGGRAWRVSINAYNKPGFVEISYYDFPYVTMGTVGVLVGWLRQRFPNAPALRTVQFVEQGLPGRPAERQLQSRSLCTAFKNVLGTPGIDNYIYYHMQDQIPEVQEFGLRQWDGTAKVAWTTWATANRDSEPRTMCGFAHLPYVQLNLVKNGNLYIVTSRNPPDGSIYRADWFWYLHHSEQPGTVMLWECRWGAASFLTTDSACNNELPYGPVGWMYSSEVPNSVPLYSCYRAETDNYFVWPRADCGGPTVTALGVLGYAYRTKF
ncbi:hypothetical protein RJ55_04320 [Drechmeria coniospora]|nr:hypothetical protein RJ55_04320 [Drechmeria coniospora]